MTLAWKYLAYKKQTQAERQNKQAKQVKNCTFCIPLSNSKLLPWNLHRRLCSPSLVLISKPQYDHLEVFASLFPLLFLCLREEQKAKTELGSMTGFAIILWKMMLTDFDDFFNYYLKLKNIKNYNIPLKQWGIKAPTAHAVALPKTCWTASKLFEDRDMPPKRGLTVFIYLRFRWSNHQQLAVEHKRNCYPVQHTSPLCQPYQCPLGPACRFALPTGWSCPFLGCLFEL